MAVARMAPGIQRTNINSISSSVPSVARFIPINMTRNHVRYFCYRSPPPTNGTAMDPLLQTALQPHIVRNAVKIALVVGSVLNLINQGEALWRGSGVSWPHVLLNFLVPYCVASYSAAKNERARRPSG